MNEPIILRHQLELVRYQEISLPKYAKVLSAQIRDLSPFVDQYVVDLWVYSNPALEREIVKVVMVKTGEPFPRDKICPDYFIQTVHTNSDAWHVFASYVVP